MTRTPVNPNPKTKPDPHESIFLEVARCRNDPNRFNTVALARGPYWSRQREICRALQRYRTVSVPTGNGVGKSYLAAGLCLWFATTRPHSKTIVAAPTQDQLAGVLWSEMEDAFLSAATKGWPLGGRMKRLRYELGENWRVEGYGSGSVESKSGRHAGELLAIVDEASGVPSGVLEAIDSLNPSKILYLGNPLRPEGKFYEVCELSGDNPHATVIKIPSLESPHIGLERSPWGMADATWLEDSRHTYGEESGERYLGIDLGEGLGGDPSSLVVRDDGGILDEESSNRWDLETVADRARAKADEFGIEPSRIVFDAVGLGVDFNNRLSAVGLVGCKPYKGSWGDTTGRYFNLRAAAAWRHLGAPNAVAGRAQSVAARPPRRRSALRG